MNISEYKFQTELHAHTSPASSCSEIPPELMIENYSRLGYDSVVITNHFYPGMKNYDDKEKCISDYLQDYNDAVKLGKEHNINVILGCEIRFSENMNDYLVYGIDEKFFEKAYEYLDKGIECFSKEFRSDDLVIFQAHPFRDGMVNANPEFLDGIEAFNMHPGHNSRIGFSCRYAKENSLLVCGGTDYHHPNHEGMISLLTKEKMQTSYDVSRILKSKDYMFRIGETVIVPYI